MRALLLLAVFVATPAFACVHMVLVATPGSREAARLDAKLRPDRDDAAHRAKGEMPKSGEKAPKGYEWKAVPCGDRR